MKSPIDVVRGQLRLSKGVWLFRPSAVDVLLRVEPVPAPDRTGFLSRDVDARLGVTARAVHAGGGTASITPRTGIPEEIVGVVRGRADGDLVVDAGIVLRVSGAGDDAPALGEPVRIELDTRSAVRCAVLPPAAGSAPEHAR